MTVFRRQYLIWLLLTILTLSSVSAQGDFSSEKKEIEELLIKANKGDASAQFWLGITYSGLKEYTQAIYWYRKAAEQGWSVAYAQIGQSYEWGYGVDKNMIEAVSWYRKAANKGDTTSIYRLGRCYFEGLGVEKNYESAVFWFRRGADAGDPTSQRALGDCYLNGQGVPQSKFNAHLLYAKSFQYFYRRLGDNLAVFQDAPFRYMAGMHFEKGLGVPLDLVEAYAYYASMSELADKRSKEALLDLEKIMTGDQIAAGKRRSADLNKEIETLRSRNRLAK